MKTISKIFLMLITLVVFSLDVEAQLHVDAQGETGIGVATPSARLHVYNTASNYAKKTYQYYAGTATEIGSWQYVNASGTGTKRGIMNYTYTSTSGTSTSYGVYNVFRSSAGTGYGIYNYTLATVAADNRTKMGIRSYVSGAGTGSKYAMYATTSSSGGGNKYGIYANASTYAGYFAGNIYVSGTIVNPSDRRLKENIADVNNALNIVKQLDAKTYTYKQDAGMRLPQGQQYGFIAQDLEQVLPAAVTNMDAIKDDSNSSRTTEKLTDEDALNAVVHEPVDPQEEKIKAVNYMALIPILVEAVKEQQKLIENQQKEIQELKNKIK